MGLAISTLTAPEKAEFQEIRALLDADETECLNKLLGLVSKDVVANHSTQEDITAAIAKWIRENVLFSTKSFCELVAEEIEARRGGGHSK